MLALVTGASSGLGKDFCEQLSKEGYDLIIVARSYDRLLEVKNKLEDEFHNNIKVITCDLSCETDILIKELENDNIDLVINNAGFGDFGEFVERDLKKIENMIDLNITSLTKLTHYFGRVMKLRGSGKILNVSSIAAFQPGPYMSAYYATKSYVLSLSEGLDYELKDYGVRVLTLCPPPTKTSFFTNAGADQSKILSVTKPLESKEVVKYTLRKIKKNKRVIVPGFGYRCLLFFEKLIPRSLTLSIMGKIQRKRKDA